MDFAAIENEENEKIAAQENEEQNDFLEDLLEDIDRQEAVELGVDNVANTGITSLKQVEYFIRRLKNLKKQQEEIEETAKKRSNEYLCKVKAWKTARLSSINTSIDFVEAHLTAYLAEELKGSSKKSISTIEGTIGIKKSSPHYEYDDEKVLKFLNETPDGERYIKRTEELRKNELKKSGEIGANGAFFLGEKSVPGVLVTYPPDKLFVR